jgi:N-methylhydantoinase A
MQAGCAVDGPAVIVEDETTTIVTSAFRAIGQDDGSLLLTRKGDAS